MKVKIKVEKQNFDSELRKRRESNDRMGIENEDPEYVMLEYSFRNELLEDFYVEIEDDRDIIAIIRGRTYRIVNTKNTLKHMSMLLNGN